MNENNIEEVLKQALPSASEAQREAARERIYNSARFSETPDDMLGDFRPAQFHGNRAVRLAAAAALVVAAIWIGVPWHGRYTYSVLKTADGAISRIVDGGAVSVHTGERIRAKEILRSDGGGVLQVNDGSRIEMRSGAELSIEPAVDGIRIHLRKGGLIIKAEKQRAGHLYVQTKDVTVSVVGTVFLVNAEEEGSRVAVIEGEVRVQQGATIESLLPGQQLRTSPKLAPLQVKEELLWSRDAEAHVALLQQAAVAPAEPRLSFEVASIRPANPGPPAPGARGAGGTGGGCGGPGPAEIDPKRFVIRNISLYHLIVKAYGVWSQPFGGCGSVASANLLSGGPDWIKSEQWDIQANIPDGIPVYTWIQLEQGKAPELQGMLQNLVAGRFKVELQREMKEMPVYLLTMAKSGVKVTPSTGSGVRTRVLPNGGFKEMMLPGTIAPGTAYKVSMAQFAAFLSGSEKLGRLVVDRTGLTGDFDFDYQARPSDRSLSELQRLSGQPLTGLANRPSLPKALEEQLGLRLEDAKEKLEVLVIKSAEKPSEN